MTLAKVEAVNKLLLEGEPGNISTDEYSGYTGYKPQALIDAMNAEFWGIWGFEEISSEIVPTGDKGGSLAVAQVKVWLKDVPSQPVGWGQNRVTRGDIGDARKGAQTDAIKKALSYFSIGNRAYQGLLKEDAGKNGHASNAHPVQSRDQALHDLAKPGPARMDKTLTNGDGTPATPKPYTLEEVRKAFLKAFKPEKWEAFKVGVIGVCVDDNGLDDAELDRLYGKLVEIRREKATASSGK